MRHRIKIKSRMKQTNSVVLGAFLNVTPLVEPVGSKTQGRALRTSPGCGPGLPVRHELDLAAQMA